MDLFGDLPSAKSGASDGVTGKSREAEEEATQTTAPRPSSASNSNTGKGAGPTSLVESIGNAGTTFAFVPAALRRKKPTAAPPVHPGAKRPRTSLQGVGLPPSEQQPPKQQDISTIRTPPTAPTRPPEISQNQEPEWLRQLHASVQPKDRYDPLVPNDYLTHRERQAQEQEQIRMERAAKEQIEVQRRVRQRIEEERRAAEEAGDIDRIVESRAASVAASLGGAGRGRGRGRGTSNLPAWLVKKQQEENEKKDGGLHS